MNKLDNIILFFLAVVCFIGTFIFDKIIFYKSRNIFDIGVVITLIASGFTLLMWQFWMVLVVGNTISHFGYVFFIRHLGDEDIDDEN